MKETTIEIVDDAVSRGVLVPNMVLINGTEVRVSEGGVRVEYDSSGYTVVRVHIELLPDKIIFRSKEEDGGEK